MASMSRMRTTVERLLGEVAELRERVEQLETAATAPGNSGSTPAKKAAATKSTAAKIN